MAKANILIDSCFWIAFYTPGDKYHDNAMVASRNFEDNNVLIPWPTLYEFINTRLARRKENLFAFQRFLQQQNVVRISDEKYKEQALANSFQLNISPTSSISLVDEVIRQMLLDQNLRIDYFLTYNAKDFEYHCQERQILILE